ncbi:molecular chaperone [Erwinia sp. 198]|jgi:fimbrial chaperone protein|uniref:fimbrial biogenesis chaperone n=1 Tax=Erwinia sp. 198 TaxID=2022746 RepID=UPI000F684589|nr:molecular chaperone [Erwinia sp. 198]RRZ96928.1 molecular chaperone [Erwinia sp. 198]
MKTLRIFTLLAGLSLLPAWAGNSVLIWPIDPKIHSGDKATELWLENRGAATTLMQVRVFSWQQQDGHEQYQTQQTVVASPPLVRIEPGQKQLVRLINQAPPPKGEERAYRVLLDEIPTPQQPGENQAGLNFQMRYSVPLFTYGEGLSADTARPDLSWRLVNQNGKSALLITNNGSGHARLSNVSLGGRTLSNSLFGYVLARSSNTFPLNFPASDRSQLSAELDNNQTWRSGSSAR